jgi:hypothetical protein
MNIYTWICTLEKVDEDVDKGITRQLIIFVLPSIPTNCLQTSVTCLLYDPVVAQQD